MAHGLLGYLGEELGYPFNQLPEETFSSFRGGVEGWGSMCGALVPAIAAIGMVAQGPDRAEMVNELMGWYREFPFPEYQEKGFDLPGVAVNSSLCHVSVSVWMNETGYGPRSTPERGERCAGLTADVCRKTAQMLNQWAEEQSFVKVYHPAGNVSYCMSCHSEAMPPYAHGKESCVDCHGDHTK